MTFQLLYDDPRRALVLDRQFSPEPPGRLMQNLPS